MKFEDEFSTGENGVFVPPSMLAQMEVVKQQMTEYYLMLEQCEETMAKNAQLQAKIKAIENGQDELRAQYESRIRKQAEKMKMLNTKYSSVEVELEKMKKKLQSSQRKNDKQKRHLARSMVELNLQRQLNYYEEQENGQASKCDTEEINKAIRSHSSLSDSLLPSSKSTIKDKQFWKETLKAASAMENDNGSISDDSCVSRQVKKNVLKMLIKNLQQEGALESDHSKSGKGDSSVCTNVRKSRKQRQNSNVTELTWDSDALLSESTSTWKQNSLKTFFTSCLTTLQDEGEYQDDDDDEDACCSIEFIQVKE